MNTKVDWIEIERRVRAGESARAISRDLTSTGHKISHTAINKHCRRGRWRLPDTSAATIAKRLQEIGTSQRTAADILAVVETTPARDLGQPCAAPNVAPGPFDAGPHQDAKAANTTPATHLDSGTTDGATQELPTERTPVETPQKKAKPPRRRTLWALQRDGTARVVGFYDKGV